MLAAAQYRSGWACRSPALYFRWRQVHVSKLSPDRGRVLRPCRCPKSGAGQSAVMMS